MKLAELIARRDANIAALEKLIETASAQEKGWTDEQRAQRENLKKQIQDDKASIADLTDVAADRVAQEAAAAAQEEADSKPVNRAIDPPNPGETAGSKTPRIETKKEDPMFGFAGLGEFICTAAKSKQSGVIDPRLVRLNEMYTNEQNKAGGDTRLLKDGAFLIPRPQSTELLETAWKVGQITAMIPETPITVGNSLHYLELDDKDLSAGKVAAGVQVVWYDEGESLSETAFKMVEKTLNLKEMGCYMIATDNMLEDAPAFESVARRLVDKAIAYELDKKVLYGPGLNSPMGMCHVNNKARILIAKETQTAKLVTENVDKMLAAFPDDADGVWVMQPKFKEVLPTLNNAGGTLQVYYQGPMADYAGKRLRATLGGFPIIFHNSAKALGSEGDIALLDPTQYTMIRKGGLKVDISIHVEFKNGKTIIRFRMRINGKPSWSSKLKLENGGHEISPYVVLAGGR